MMLYPLLLTYSEFILKSESAWSKAKPDRCLGHRRLFKMLRSSTRHAALLVNSLFITSSLVVCGCLVIPVKATESVLLPSDVTLPSTTLENASSQPDIPDGTYLYGESPQPDQIGSTYLVFQVKDNQATGALYLPHSSFDCFQGQVQGDRLNLSITNSYDHSIHTYSLPVQIDSYVASAGEAIVPSVQLTGYHAITTLSDNDQRILATCQADFE